VNSAGEVAGWSYVIVPGDPIVRVHAFSWTKAGGIVDLHDLVRLAGTGSAASEISDTGEIVGYSQTAVGLPHAYSWTPSGGLVDLGTLPGGSTSRATRVNNGGEVVGWADTTQPPPGADSGIRHGFVWTNADGMTDLGTFGGPASTAADVNDSGEVAGYSDLPSGAWHAFVWTPAGGMKDIGTLGGTTSTAHAINANGQIAGQSPIAAGPAHAFSWTPTGGMVDLGTLGGFTSSAQAIDDSGEVVGYSETATGAVHAFSWTKAGGMIDLGGLVGNGNSQAEAVNESGDIVGWRVTPSGHTLATLWPADGLSLQCLASLPHSVAVAIGATGRLLVGPHRWKTGITEISPSSSLPQGTVLTLVRLRAGYGFGRFLADQSRAQQGGTGSGAAWRRVLANAVFLGGIGGVPGAATLTASLAPGTYYLGEFSPVSRWIRIRALGTGVAHLPATQAVVTAYDFGFRTTGMLPAAGTIMIRSVGGQPHRLTLFPVRPGTSRTQLARWVRATNGRPGTAAPFALPGPKIASSLISPGVSAELSYRLPPGKYAMVSYQRDAFTGKTQLAEGMYDLVTLG
jgi:probable HAF family extracellular repeat protein